MSASDTIAALLDGGVYWLAPLAGVGDPIFRELCREQGAGLTYTEMVSAKGLEYNDVHTKRMLCLAANETQAGVQLFGHEPKVMAEQARVVEEEWGSHLALIDINMGCPVGKVVKKGEGAALMKTPKLAGQIVEAVKEAVDVPVTVKCRTGFSAQETVICDFARRMEDCGASLVTIHGRSAQQLYRGKADWDIIAQAKRCLNVPVIGNGDVFSLEQAREKMAQTGVDGVMIARGAQGNPWVFSGKKPTRGERIDYAERHVLGIYDLYGIHAMGRVRKHVAWYMAGFPHATSIRARVMCCETPEEFEELFCVIRSELGEES